MATRIRGNAGGYSPSSQSSSRSATTNAAKTRRTNTSQSAANTARRATTSARRATTSARSATTSSRSATTSSQSAARTSRRTSTSYQTNTSRNTSRRTTTSRTGRSRNQDAPQDGIKRIFYDAVFKKAEGEMDYTFLTIVIAVLATGLVILLSASTPRANTMYGYSYYFFVRQFAFAVAGVVGMLLLSKIDYKLYRPLVPTAVVIGIILLILVAIPGIGTVRNGARRWLFGIQPSELMKPIAAMAVANMITNQNLNMKKITNIMVPGIFLAVVSALMFLEPHVSGAVIIVGIAGCIMLVAGFPVLPVVILGSLGGFGVVMYAKIFSPTRWARLMNFFNPFADAQGTSFQIAQSIYSIGSGGITGRGLGQSLQKFQFLPEPYNDFIFSIVCEELGLIGAIFVMGLFALLIIRGARIAMNAPDRYSMLLATGIVAQVAIQSIMNMGVASGTIPNTGVSLPFFSYGGTSLFTLLCEMGILLNISRQSKRN